LKSALVQSPIYHAVTNLPLYFHEDIGESTWAATVECRAAPFLYKTGWVLEYSSLSAELSVFMYWLTTWHR